MRPGVVMKILIIHSNNKFINIWQRLEVHVRYARCGPGFSGSGYGGDPARGSVARGGDASRGSAALRPAFVHEVFCFPLLLPQRFFSLCTLIPSQFRHGYTVTKV